ncbi:hypothetical protein I4U23_027231 [Adineta vaga]|nr:hypothetical protein I4U23_027231 [Adineta vaga]
MFQFKVFIVLAIITNALTNPVANQPARCCSASRYTLKTDHTVYYLQQDGTNATKSVYDAESGFYAVAGTTQSASSNQSSFRHLTDSKNKAFYIINPDVNTCAIFSNPSGPENCIHETATYANSSIYIFNGKRILVDTWIIENNDYMSYRKVSRDGCVQIEAGYAMKTDTTHGKSITSDYVEDIIDPTIFEIPSYCH